MKPRASIFSLGVLSFFAVSQTGRVEGLDFTIIQPQVTQDTLYAVTEGGGTFVAVGANSGTARSLPGVPITWEVTPFSALRRELRAVAYGADRDTQVFLASGQKALGFESTDGYNWEFLSDLFPDFSKLVKTNITAVGLAFTNGTFVAVSDFFQISWASASDLGTWHLVEQSAVEKFRAVAAFGPANFAAVGVAGLIKVSSDSGQTWRAPLHGAVQGQDLLGVAFGAGKLVAVGASGRIAVSSDRGESWQDFATSVQPDMNAVTYAGDRFIAVGKQGTILTSFDGTTWVPHAQSSKVTANDLFGVTYASAGLLQGYTAVVGANGTILLGRETPTNSPPTGSYSPVPVIAPEDHATTVTLIGQDAETSANDLVFTITAAPTNGTLKFGTSALSVGSKLPPGSPKDVVYQPNTNYNGSDHFTFIVTDTGDPPSNPPNVQSSAPVPVSISTTPVNDAPSFTKGTNQTVLEDAGAKTVPAWVKDISPGPPDEADQTLTFLLSNDHNELFSAQPAVAANGTLTYTPAPNATGIATVTVVLRDSGGTANGGVDRSAPQTFTITITPVNDPPTLDPIPDRTVPENAGVQTVDLTGITSDEAGQKLTVTAVSDNPSVIPNPTPAYTSPNPTGTLQYILVANKTGTARITVTVSDDGGTANGGVNFTNKTFTVTVAAVTNAPPMTMTPPTKMDILEDASTVVTLTASDKETSPEDLIFTINAEPVNGTLKLGTRTLIAEDTLKGSPQNLIYQPNADYDGPDSFEFKVTDTGNPTGSDVRSSTNMVKILVISVNDPPTLAFILDMTIPEDPGEQRIPLTRITVGPANEVGQNVKVTATSNNPSVIPDPIVTHTGPDSAGLLSFTPVANASGVATITVTVHDDGGTENGGSDTTQRSFVVNVLPCNDPPTLDPIPDRRTTQDTGPHEVPLTGISSGAADEREQVLFNLSSSNPGLIPAPVINYDGPPGTTATLIYTPVAGASGSATISIVVIDTASPGICGANRSNRQFDVQVLPVNHAPQGADNTIKLVENADYTFTATDFGFIDPLDEPLPNDFQAVKIASLPLEGFLTLNEAAVATGQFVYKDFLDAGHLKFQPKANEAGTNYARFTFQVQDNGGVFEGGTDLDPTPNTIIFDVGPKLAIKLLRNQPNQVLLEWKSSQTVWLQSAQFLTNGNKIVWTNIVRGGGNATATFSYTTPITGIETFFRLAPGN